MLIDINEITVSNRIRKDFGNLEELAEDIKKNGLINPLTVNSDYKLLAGERRLRACKLLGWNQVDVRVVKSDDETHDLAVEMSENNLRRNFTGSELAEGIRRQMALESEKAKKRMQDPMQTFAEGQTGTSRDKAAEQFGISGEQARKTLFVDDNRDLLDPTDFAEWDEGKLSTNKAFQRIKAAQRQAIKERDEARKDAEDMSELYGKVVVQRDEAREDLASERGKNDNLRSQNAGLRKELDRRMRSEPEVIEREVEVVREVVPEAMQRRVSELEHLERIHCEDNQKLRRNLEELRKELDRAKVLLEEKGYEDNASWDISALTSATNQYLRMYGGKVWAFDQFYRVDEVTQQEFVKAMTNLAAFAQNTVQYISDSNKLEA